MIDFRSLPEQISGAGAFVGAGSAVTFWGLQLSDIAVVASAIFAGASFATHLWLSIQRNRREAEAHRKEMGDGKEADGEGSPGDG